MQMAFNVGSKFGDAGVALLGLLAQGLEDDRIQITAQLAS